ncbi:hypothetical protein DFH11DRAFT_1504481 [Phellopilus nigrolimitatus]|nr:hypothetical protein DFH11DRAFT_1528444 [Phellopilus nigrolimitatus]KAH8117572.1 hypothetical protein DFH11DRAFT_1504481 [Phellopilus nigrolimitatus]
MANPSSSHHDRDRERERERTVRERSHHHHRTISSTTLLLILSLVLAVLAVMLSLPSTRTPGSSSALNNPIDSLRDSTTNGAGIWGSFFNPRRSEALVSREHSVAKRESEVAQREADILANALVTCGPPYATVTEVVENYAPAPPAQTIYKEIVQVQEKAVAVPAPENNNSAELTRRIEELIQRETKVADREKEMGRREETVNRREHDAQRRESWIMEQLIALGNDPQMIEEEYFIEQPPPGQKQRKVKVPLSTPRRSEL